MTLTKDADVASTGDSMVTKVVVAVHGVGEQHEFATIQSVVNQFCTFHHEPAAIPLGKFHNNAATFSMKAPFCAERLQHLAFAEVYWAPVPRELVKSGYKLEEAKKWAGTILGRLRMRCKQEGVAVPACVHLKMVLHEMIEALGVLERLCFLASKAGLFDFDVKKLLDDYLGDVQVVTEFDAQRDEILTLFRETMERVCTACPDAKIYVVAHSEGTVVSFLGLLAGIRAKAPWVDKVGGLMTFGSPLDKHLMLWRELFEPKTSPPDWSKRERIEWRNYYDKGDPIGFALEHTGEWLRDNGWTSIFNFEREHDIGFSRYPLPGKAHIDYWNDKEVFSHFIGTVVQEKRPPEKEDAAKAAGKVTRKSAAKLPRDIPWTQCASYLVPYIGVATLLFVAVYVLFKAVRGYTAPGTDDPVVYVLRSVAAIAILLLGVTMTARIPRLTPLPCLHGTSLLAYAACVPAYLWLLPPGQPSAWKFLGKTWVLESGETRLILSLLVVILVYGVSWLRPEWGVKPLLVLGGAAIVGCVAVHMASLVGADHGKLWPVVLGAAGFFYLWWLAALLLDLVFAWHVYVRHEQTVRGLDAIVGSKARAKAARAKAKEVAKGALSIGSWAGVTGTRQGVWSRG